MTTDNETPELIAEQRAKGWPDFDPEDFCHRCGRPNMVWAVASPLWNAAEIESETPSGIVCPPCFEAAFRARVPSPLDDELSVAWSLVPDHNTLRHLPDELRAEEAAWREAYDDNRLPEYHAALEASGRRGVDMNAPETLKMTPTTMRIVAEWIGWMARLHAPEALDMARTVDAWADDLEEQWTQNAE